MKIDIKAKIKGFDKDFENLGESIVKDMQRKLELFSKAAYNEGLRLASERLGTSLVHYQNNLRYEKISDNIYQIFLIEDSPAINIEEGMTGFDMKPGFLRSNKAKQTKSGEGTYLDVPFRIQPHSQSRANKRIVDMRSAVQAAVNDRTVEKRIKNFNKDSKGIERFGDVTRYLNTGDPRTEGLVKITPPKTRSSRYFLFRRVSNNSPSSSWLHPGHEGAKIFPDLEAFVNEGIDKLLKNILR